LADFSNGLQAADPEAVASPTVSTLPSVLGFLVFAKRLQRLEMHALTCNHP
jgi:hypothetical protein